MARPKLTLYLDIVSPFAYLAFHVTHYSPAFKKCDVTYVPIFLGGVMKACGNQPPINIKNKDKWINEERIRWAKYANIPIAPKAPEGFPPLTVQVMRAICAIEMSMPEKLEQVFAELYLALWVNGKQAQKVEVFGPVIEQVLGAEKGKEILERIGSPEVKAQLQKNTDAAFEAGAFGLPWFVATNTKGETQGYWGFDHLGQVMDHLGLERGKETRAML